jgi:hypothetical protein
LPFVSIQTNGFVLLRPNRTDKILWLNCFNLVNLDPPDNSINIFDPDSGSRRWAHWRTLRKSVTTHCQQTHIQTATFHLDVECRRSFLTRSVTRQRNIPVEWSPIRKLVDLFRMIWQSSLLRLGWLEMCQLFVGLPAAAWN